MLSKLPSRDLVLVGAGHTNMHIVKKWRMEPIPNVQLTLVSPFSRATYSGMLPGTLAGLYEPYEMEIDLYRISAGSSVRLIVSDVTGFDPERREVQFSDRPPIRYDIASIGIGSIPSAREIWKDDPRILSIKPMQTFRKRLQSAIGRLDESRRTSPRFAVVGGGAAGVEVTLGIDTLLRNRGTSPQVSLIDSNKEILKGNHDKTAQLARKEMLRRGITIRTNVRVERNDRGELVDSSGDPIEADIVFWATGAAPPPVLAGFQLPKSDEGFLLVDATLKTTADFPVFVVGDTASFTDQNVPRAGVYAVREGPVLWENIQRLLNGHPLEEYHPQKGFLSLLSTGDGRAIAEYKGFSIHSRLAWKLKDYIDRKFMRMHQMYEPMGTEEMKSTAASKVDTTPEMRCRGCGGKVGAGVLSAALEKLDVPTHPDVLQGLEHPDDAALVKLSQGKAHVLSVDFFQPFLDDPYIVGRVAALNSLSDLWASGAQPVGALASVTIPEGPPRKQTELLYQLLAGGLHELKKCGATIIGGHTTEGSELTIGYTVVGQFPDAQQGLKKAGLGTGDRLLLTKPLGTATLLAANDLAKCRAEWMDALLEIMLISNEGAMQVALTHRDVITAATDITGFGLAGHLLEMLRASRAIGKLNLEKLPLYDGFAELCEEGVRSSLYTANREVESQLEITAGNLNTIPGFHALFDPQTSGGMLFGVASEKAAEVTEALKSAGYAKVSDIGEIVETSEAANFTPRLIVD